MRVVPPPIEELAQQAAEIAKEGWPVFPCGFDKAPLTLHGHKDAISNPRLAYDLFIRHPDARLVGVPMGTEAATVVAIDVDPQGMKWLHQNWNRLGNPRVHKTPRGGAHLLYKMPKIGPIIDCRQVVDGERLLSVGVDIKGLGGYICFAGPGYTVLNDVEPCDMPAWLKNRIIRQPKAPKEKRTIQIHQGARGFEVALARLEYSKEGNRNDLLFWTACRAGELVREGLLTETNAISLCATSGQKAGLSELEARRTATSGVRKGKGT